MQTPRRQAFRSFMAATFIALTIPFVLASPYTNAAAPAKQHGKAQDLGTGAGFDRNGMLWVVMKETDDNEEFVVLQGTSDLGKTWTPKKRITSIPEPVTARGEARPHIAFGPQGEMYVTYTSTIARPHVGNIRFLRSLDGGRTFSAPMTVQKNSDAVTHSFESILVDQTGKIFIAWIDGRDAGARKARKEAYAGSAVYYTVSTNQGTSFSNDFKLADHACECCRISVALHPKRGPMAFWRHVFEPNIRDHAVAVLHSDGQPSTVTRVTFDDWRIDACPHHGPSMAFSPDGRRHQVWFNGNESGGGARYAWAPLDGSPGKPVPLGSSQAIHPDIAVNGNDIAMAWKEFDGVSTSIEARWSTDDGKSWRQASLAGTTGESDKPYLLSGPDGIVLVWRTQLEGVRVVPVTEGKQ